MRILFVSLFIILVDQVSKFLVKGVNLPALGITVKGMSPRVPIHVIDNFFNLTFIENPGMAFGLEIGSKELRSVFTIFASILIVYFIYKNRHEIFYLRFSLALILGGAIGNLIDRIFYGVIYGSDGLLKGNVVDFFQLNIPDLKIFGKTFYSWPIFNVADIAVTCGFILILIGYKKIFTKKEVEEQKPSDLNVLETNNDVSIPMSSTAVENEKNINEEKPQLPS